MSQHSILHTLAPQLRQQFAEQTQVMTFPSGQVLFNPGERCQGLPLVLSGVVKVQMTGFGYRAEANVEDEVEVVMVPRPLFDRLMDQSDGFRKGIMESYGRRLDDLMLLVE